MKLLCRLAPGIVGAACLLVLAASVCAQEPGPLVRKVVLPGESADAAARLKAADRLVESSASPRMSATVVGLAGPPPFMPFHLASSAFADHALQQDWSAALDEYQRMIYDDGDTLVLDEGSDRRLPTLHSLPVRRLCNLRIAAAPSHVLALYRKRVDLLAGRLFRDGAASHDTAVLRRLVNDLFCSRFGDRALDMLGDLAFERGDFAEAAEWWRLLALPASAAEGTAARTLLFPAPQVDVVRVRAKLILAQAFAGERDQAGRELQAFRGVHGSASGKLAGKEGEFASVIEEVIRRLPAAVDDEPWTTFAGNPGRNRVPASIPSPRSWVDGPTWRVGLPNAGLADSPVLFSRLAARLCYHPVIAGDRVFLTDGRSVIGHDLLSGRLLFRYSVQTTRKVAFSTMAPGAAPRFSLSVAGDRVYARLGEQALGSGIIRPQTFLVCLAVPPTGTEGPAAQVREVWSNAAPDGSQFEGAPLIHAGLVYIASSRVENRRTRTSLHCFDADTGKPHWSQEICDTPEFEENTSPRYRHHLLTLAVDNIVYCSHAGAIVAVDRLTGKQSWAVRYAGRGPEVVAVAGLPHDLCPCAFQFGRIFAAPADADRVFCLDSSTGQVLWESEGIEVASLLGVAQNQLLLAERKSGLRALSADGGATRWRQPSAGSLPSFGRGLLAGDLIFWPTHQRETPVFLLRQKDGEQAVEATQLRHIHPGNMAFANGCLVVAGTDYLFGYVAPERLLRKLQAQAGQPQATAWTLYRLAQAEAGAGHFTSALAHFAKAAAAGTEEKRDNVPVRTPAVAHQHALLMELARRAGTDQEKAIARLRQAAGSEFPPAQRVSSLFALAERCRQTGEPTWAIAAYRTILAAPATRQVTIRTRTGSYRSAAALAAERLAEANAVGPPPETSAKDARPHTAQPPRPTDRSARDLSVPLTPTWQAIAGKLLVPALNHLSPKRISDTFFFAQNKLVCRDAASGEVRWQQPLSFAPAWLGLHSDIVLVGGDEAVLSLRLSDGRHVWRFGLPFVPEDAANTLPGLPLVATGSFSRFHLAGSRLIFLLDRKELFALSLETGEVSWVRQAPGVAALGASGRFCPQFHADDKLVLIQADKGKRLAFKSDTGQLLCESQGSRSPWLYPPFAVGRGRLCIVDGGRVILLDAASGRELWSYAPAAALTLTGEAPQVVSTGNGLLVMVPRNIGYDLVRLDPQSGRPMWDEDDIRLAALSGGDFRTGTSDQSNFWCAADGKLACWDLATGKRVWQNALPEKSARWQVLPARNALIVYPAQRKQSPWLWLPVGETLLGLPNTRFQENRSNQSCVLMHDRKTGKVLQQLYIQVADTALEVQVLAGAVVVAAAGKAWAFASD